LLFFKLLFSLISQIILVDSLVAEVLLHLVNVLAFLVILPVLATEVAELVSTPASHVIAPMGLFYPISAAWALLAF